jgi:glutamyl-tRNA reductase
VRDRELIGQLLHRVASKLLHGPTKTLRDTATDGSVGVYADVLRRMFDLKDEDDEGK